MGPTNLSLRNRFLLLQEEFRDRVVGITFFCAFALAIVVPIVTRQNSPIVGTQRVGGIVEYVTTMPLNPKVSVGQGFHYRYEVRLDDSNAVILVDGEVETPHMIGSEVSVEEQHRQNGTSTYRLLND
ncbi:hypothetical protein NKI56_10180 [Mesorhizobium sp. M0622]|uniref:hypothetical protein n=1 Tax=unclassified Mesorhizobium TaxID=325217 RepID=UPI00333DBEBF